MGTVTAPKMRDCGDIIALEEFVQGGGSSLRKPNADDKGRIRESSSGSLLPVESVGGVWPGLALGVRCGIACTRADNQLQDQDPHCAIEIDREMVECGHRSVNSL